MKFSDDSFSWLVGLAREVVALALLLAHGEQAHARALDAEDVARRRRGP
jgi:hypothetical protein